MFKLFVLKETGHGYDKHLKPREFTYPLYTLAAYHGPGEEIQRLNTCRHLECQKTAAREFNARVRAKR